MPSIPSVLPSSLASAISTIQWPLGPSSSPPLHFENIEKMRQIRSSKLIDILPTTFEEMSSSSKNDDHHYFGLVSAALILVGNGYTDEAHDLVTPLSWPQDTHFGYGPSVYEKVTPDAKTFATYVHCLVHRREAFNVGEFGMVGFQNANYWSNTLVESSSFTTAFPHDELFQKVLGLQSRYEENDEIMDWYCRHDLANPNQCWETRAVHELCASVLKKSQSDEAEGLQQFAEVVAETELRVVLKHALTRAGFEYPHEILSNHNDPSKNDSVNAK